MHASSSSTAVPLGWEWAEDILTQYDLPKLGLPVKWAQTAQRHQNVAYDARTKQAIDLRTGRKTTRSIDFITATKGKNVIHGTEEPASVRVERYYEPCFHQHFIKDASGHTLAPCIAHGDYVKVESLESDHVQAKENIFKRQVGLVEKLNEDAAFADFLVKQPGMEKFFVKHEGKYYGTLFYYEVYFNDVDNIWLICDACNSQKSNGDTLNWFENQWLYGQEFLDYLARQQVAQTDTGILLKTADQRGLAEVAIAWFWERHANYVSVSQRIQQSIVVPLSVLNIQADRIIGYSAHRGARLEASLNAKILLAESMVKAPGLGMPKPASDSSHSSSDDALRMTPLKDTTGQELVVTPGTYERAATEVAAAMPDFVKGLLKTKIKESLAQKQKVGDSTPQKTRNRKGRK